MRLAGPTGGIGARSVVGRGCEAVNALRSRAWPNGPEVGFKLVNPGKNNSGHFRGPISGLDPSDAPIGLVTAELDSLESGRLFQLPGFLSHLHSLVVTMSQKSSLVQYGRSVSKALTPDTEGPTSAFGRDSDIQI